MMEITPDLITQFGLVSARFCAPRRAAASNERLPPIAPTLTAPAAPAQMNKISSGNSMVDVLLCLLVPMILKHIVPLVKVKLTKLFSIRNVESNVYTREIQHVTKWVRRCRPRCAASVAEAAGQQRLASKRAPAR
jgi:hypothetical protein